MEDNFYFKSGKFRIHKNEDEETNPGCYGKELGLWLCEEFTKLGYDVEELIPEDWGWCVMCSRDEYLLWIGCGAMSDHENYNPDNPPEGRDVTWLAFPHIEVPFFKFKSLFKKWTGGLDLDQPLKKLKEELQSLLENETEIELCDEP
ncbi:hypothetical protein [Aliikangiella maris]|uniref:DUF2750 domain-containing protein n=1 Tax=Aliikangiella maris TaxID=3162458 RepID=A0ABV2C0F0_9GAMM